MDATTLVFSQKSTNIATKYGKWLEMFHMLEQCEWKM